MIRFVITDIEGTTTPISFVHRVLFPYARPRLHDFVEKNSQHSALTHVPEPKLDTLIQWMDLDKKITALKTIQGEIWKEGFTKGHLLGEVYSDVPPILNVWASAGIHISVYSSGSVDAQKLLFGHTVEGDLTSKFKAFFDTNIGPKTEADSYRKIIHAIGGQSNETLFLSDTEVELDAAAATGLSVCQLVRLTDKTLPSNRHPLARDFYDVSSLFGLSCE